MPCHGARHSREFCSVMVNLLKECDDAGRHVRGRKPGLLVARREQLDNRRRVRAQRHVFDRGRMQVHRLCCLQVAFCAGRQTVPRACAWRRRRAGERRVAVQPRHAPAEERSPRCLRSWLSTATARERIVSNLAARTGGTQHSVLRATPSARRVDRRGTHMGFARPDDLVTNGQ
jgi:hypothetical protein